MKKILSILGAISLVGTTTTSLVACNKPQEYTTKELEHLKKENQIDTTNETIKNNLEWIAPQEKPFNKVDNKWYYVVWKSKNWNITKFKNNEEIQNKDSFKVLEQKDEYKLELHRYSLKYEVDLNVYEPSNMTNWPWRIDHGNYFKFVYRWNGEEQNLPNLDIDKDGTVKVSGE
ncbi:MAG: lipoprotein [Spiroplasma sp. hy2]|uniref:lipoprotein n=1 Tax=Spiroplasma sp. hy2 TaxID=2490850 RepID=UPI00383D04BD